MSRTVKRFKLDHQKIPVIFDIHDILISILDYLSYPDCLSLRCCRKLAFEKLPIERLYKKKSEYLRDLGVPPVMIAKIYKNKSYLNTMTIGNFRINQPLLFKSLLKCQDLKLVSGVLSELKVEPDNKYRNIISQICLRFIGGPVTKTRVELIRKHCDQKGYTGYCIKLDNVGYFKILDCSPYVFQAILENKAYKILAYICEIHKPPKIWVRTFGDIFELQKFSEIVENLGYVRSNSPSNPVVWFRNL